MDDEDEVALFTLPSNLDASSLKDDLLRLISRQEDFIQAQSPAKNAELIHKYLGFHLGVLDIEPKIGIDQPSTRMGHSVSPLKVNLASLSPRACLELKVKSMQLLLNLFKRMKKSRVFAFWYILLPKCAFNPCQKGILELITHPNQVVRETALDLLSETFQASSTHLQLANAHCRVGSFTPVCLEFALALGRMVRFAVQCFHEALEEGQPSHVSHTSRAIVVLFEQLPFHRLENGLISEVFDRLLQPSCTSPRSNPVILIAVLQIFAVLLSVSPAHDEVKCQFDTLFEWFLSLAFPVSDLKPLVDNNIRYVSIQNLGLTSTLDASQFMQRMPTLHPLLEEAIKCDKDQSVVIHVLRLLKTIGKSGQILDNAGPETDKRMLHFWLGVLKASLIDSVEARDCPVLKAALCNCVAEIGGSVFCQLPTDRRMLAVTFMLRMCRDSDHRTVTAATRGLGMLVALPTLQNDVAFLTDSAEIMQDIFQKSGDKQAHQSVVTSCTWALANLSDSLTKHHSQPEIDDIFPPYLVLELIRIAIEMSFSANNHLNVRSNSVRSLGSLLQCLNALTKYVVIDDSPEVGHLCEKAIEALVANISSGKVMKVRWNACYAAGGILKTTNPTICTTESRQKLLDALLPVMQTCLNYKVRINAALALTSIKDRSTFGLQFIPATLTVVKSLEAALNNLEDSDEVQHRSDLVDQLCATYAHLISICTLADLTELEPQVLEHMELLSEAMRSALLRISPEKTTVFVDAKRHLNELANLAKKPLSCQIFPTHLVDSYVS